MLQLEESRKKLLKVSSVLVIYSAWCTFILPSGNLAGLSLSLRSRTGGHQLVGALLGNVNCWPVVNFIRTHSVVGDE